MLQAVQEHNVSLPFIETRAMECSAFMHLLNIFQLDGRLRKQHRMESSTHIKVIVHGDDQSVTSRDLVADIEPVVKEKDNIPTTAPVVEAAQVSENDWKAQILSQYEFEEDDDVGDIMVMMIG